MLPETVLSFISEIKLQNILLLVFGVASVLALSKIFKGIVRYLCDLFPSNTRFWMQVYTILSFPIFIVSLLFVVYKGISPPREFILAFLGSATFAIGFALKDFIGSIISGWSIALDSPFQVGDTIKFKDIEGKVSHIGLRVVKVRTLDNEVVTIPNIAFLSDAVLCRNLGVRYLCVTACFYVSIDSSPQLVRNIILDSIYANKFAHHEIKPTIIFQNTWRADYLCLEVIVKSNVIHSDFARDYNSNLVEKINQLFIENGITVPFRA